MSMEMDNPSAQSGDSQGGTRSREARPTRRLLALGGCLMFGLWAAGCAERTRSADDIEREHPLMKAAQEKERAGDEAAAIGIYKSLSAQNPDMARPHLALAFLMDKPGRDPAGAIYHYQRYLELRPDSEKRDMLAARIRQAKIQLISTVFPSVSNLSERLLVEVRENEQLRIRVTNLTSQIQYQKAVIGRLRDQTSALDAAEREAIEAVAPPSAGIRPAVRTVVVAKGDTLIKLAARVYGDGGRWRDILDANRNVLRNQNDIRSGQLLVLP